MSQFFLSLKNPEHTLQPGDVWYQADRALYEHGDALVYELLDYFDSPKHRGQILGARVWESDAKLHHILNKVRERIFRMLGTYDDGLKGLEIFFQNLPFLQRFPNIDQFTTPYTKAIYIAAGPSADVSEDLETLRKIHDSRGALIACCDIMLDWCLSHGITPHLCVSVERDSVILDALKNVPKETLLVVSEVIPTPIFERTENQFAFLIRGSGAVRWLADDLNHRVVRCGVSVSPSTLAALHLMGIEEVWTYGLDCGFPVGTNNSHCNYNVNGIEFFKEYSKPWTNEEFQKQKVYQTPGNVFAQVNTTGLWQHYGAVTARYAVAHGLKMINCSRLGAKIPATPYRPLQEFVAESVTSKPWETNFNGYDAKQIVALEKRLWDEADHIYSLTKQKWPAWKDRDPRWLSENDVLKDLALSLLTRERIIYEGHVFLQDIPEAMARANFAFKLRSAVQDIFLILEEYLDGNGRILQDSVERAKKSSA